MKSVRSMLITYIFCRTVIREKKHSKASIETDAPPEFIIKPRRQFVYEGQGAKFKASFEGSSSTFLTWSKDDSVLYSSRKIKVISIPPPPPPRRRVTLGIANRHQRH